MSRLEKSESRPRSPRKDRIHYEKRQCDVSKHGHEQSALENDRSKGTDRYFRSGEKAEDLKKNNNVTTSPSKKVIFCSNSETSSFEKPQERKNYTDKRSKSRGEFKKISRAASKIMGRSKPPIQKKSIAEGTGSTKDLEIKESCVKLGDLEINSEVDKPFENEEIVEVVAKKPEKEKHAQREHKISQVHNKISDDQISAKSKMRSNASDDPVQMKSDHKQYDKTSELQNKKSPEDIEMKERTNSFEFSLEEQRLQHAKGTKKKSHEIRKEDHSPSQHKENNEENPETIEDAQRLSCQIKEKFDTYAKYLKGLNSKLLELNDINDRCGVLLDEETDEIKSVEKEIDRHALLGVSESQAISFMEIKDKIDKCDETVKVLSIKVMEMIEKIDGCIESLKDETAKIVKLKEKTEALPKFDFFEDGHVNFMDLLERIDKCGEFMSEIRSKLVVMMIKNNKCKELLKEESEKIGDFSKKRSKDVDRRHHKKSDVMSDSNKSKNKPMMEGYDSHSEVYLNNHCFETLKDKALKTFLADEEEVEENPHLKKSSSRRRKTCADNLLKFDNLSGDSGSNINLEESKPEKKRESEHKKNP